MKEEKGKKEKMLKVKNVINCWYSSFNSEVCSSIDMINTSMLAPCFTNIPNVISFGPVTCYAFAYIHHFTL